MATSPNDMSGVKLFSLCSFAEQYNAHVGITGILTFHNGTFAQLLEGPESELRSLIARIAKDRRHHSMKMLSDVPIMKRRYADWSMKLLKPHDFVQDQLKQVLDQTEAVVGQIHEMSV